MSYFRKYLPEVINNNVMYCVGKLNSVVQYYTNNEFSASAITDKLYIGNLASSTNLSALKDIGITHIVSVYNGGIEMFPKDFIYKIININDDPWVNIEDYFDESNDFINESLKNPNAKVMIHCQKGVSRSVTLLIAYLLLQTNKINCINYDEIDDTIETMLKEVKIQRPIADPNKGFKEELKKYIIRLNKYTLD
jgi:protein-tyrosine phosphatase